MLTFISECDSETRVCKEKGECKEKGKEVRYTAPPPPIIMPLGGGGGAGGGRAVGFGPGIVDRHDFHGVGRNVHV